MNRLQAHWNNWRQDKLLGGVIRNAGYLFSSNTVSIALGVVQSILAARLLGVAGFGVLGTITVFASTVNRLFSFRMGELVIKYLGASMGEDQKERGAAIVKVAALAEGGSSLLAFACLLLTAPLAARYLAHDSATTWMFQVYGLSILGNLVTETSVGILQLDKRFGVQAGINIAQSLLTMLIIVAAFFSGSGMLLVLLAYLLGKLILGIGPMVAAVGSLRRMLGANWLKARLALLPAGRELARFALSTNFSATINLLVRDSELLWVAFFLSPVEAGYYKVALAIINLVILPITPITSATFPELSLNVARRKWGELKRLLRRVTLIAGAWVGGVSLVLLVFGKWLVMLYGKEYLPAYGGVLVLLVGAGFANVLFWNRPLLLSLGLPMVPFRATLYCGIVKVLLAFPLVPRFGYIAEAALLSGYFFISVAIIVGVGMRELRHQAALPAPEGGGA